MGSTRLLRTMTEAKGKSLRSRSHGGHLYPSIGPSVLACWDLGDRKASPSRQLTLETARLSRGTAS